MRVASAYLPHQHLISSDYFPAYKKALEIAILIVAVITLLRYLPYGLNPVAIIQIPFFLFWSLLDVGGWVFAGVTISFYLMEVYNVNVDKLYSWSPKQLNFASKKLTFSRFDTFVEIFFTGLFLMWWSRLFEPESFFLNYDVIQNVSLSLEWDAIFWVVNFLVGFSLLLAIFKFIFVNRYRATMFTDILLNIGIIFTIIYITRFDVFVLIKSPELSKLDWHTIHWTIELNVKIILWVVTAASVWDIYANIRKLRGN